MRSHGVWLVCSLNGILRVSRPSPAATAIVAATAESGGRTPFGGSFSQAPAAMLRAAYAEALMAERVAR